MPSLGGVCALVGEGLRPLFDCEIVWRGDRIVEIEANSNGRLQDVEHIVLPSFINAHTHIGDSLAKEAYIGLGLEEAVDPHKGLKTKIISTASKNDLVKAMRSVLEQCVSLGVTHLIDFREGGLEGLSLGREASQGLDIDLLLLGRLATPPSKGRILENQGFTDFELEELHKVCEKGNGLGISGANEYSDKMLTQIREIVRGQNKLLAVHCLESHETRGRLKGVLGRDEFQRCFNMLRPDVFVHMTDATPQEISYAFNIGVVVSCPRSNAALGNGFPPLTQILNGGGGLGTDNVMVNSPDMFREMEFAYKCLVGTTRKPFQRVEEVLKSATVNLRPRLGLKPIEVDAEADFMVLNVRELRPFWNLSSLVVNRAQRENIEQVVRKGRKLYEKPVCV